MKAADGFSVPSSAVHLAASRGWTSSVPGGSEGLSTQAREFIHRLLDGRIPCLSQLKVKFTKMRVQGEGLGFQFIF